MRPFNKRQFLKFGLATGAALTLAACGGGDDDPAPAAPSSTSLDLVEVLGGRSEYSLLVEAVQTAGLVSILKGTGPFTVFAPTNAAFSALLTELNTTKSALFANTALLTAVLTYHVLPAQVAAADIPFGRAITSVEGSIFKIDSVSGAPVITDGRNRTANITQTNLFTRNGVIHQIDKVILPADKDIVATALALAPEFSLLVEAVQTAGLVSTLQSDGPFTVFAPTNAAFAAALTELGVDKDTLFGDVPLLTQILTYHVLGQRVLKADVPLNTAITTVEGTTFQVNSSLAIIDAVGRSANILNTDVLTSNGVIHVIDKVILPALPAA